MTVSFSQFMLFYVVVVFVDASGVAAAPWYGIIVDVSLTRPHEEMVNVFFSKDINKQRTNSIVCSSDSILCGRHSFN